MRSLAAAVALTAVVAVRPAAAPAVPVPGAACSAPVQLAGPADYFTIELVPTGRVPGTGRAVGVATVTFARSPFGVAVSSDGAYVQALDIRIERARQPRSGVFAVWASSHDLEHVALLGVLGDDLRLEGRVRWNKFLVVVSLEPAADALGDRWQGPIVMRGMSRSGRMHTMAGHGAFQGEPCIKYGYK